MIDEMCEIGEKAGRDMQLLCNPLSGFIRRSKGNAERAEGR
jgi:hypothetical protein